MNYYKRKSFWFILIMSLPILYAGIQIIEDIFSPPCLSSKQVTNKTTPETLFPAALKCFRKKKNDEGVFLSMIAYTYSSFDQMRISDKSAGEKLKEKVENKLLNKLSWAQEDIYDDTKSDILNDYSGGFAKLYRICKEIKRIGMPNYYPTYIIPSNIHQKGAPFGLLIKTDLAAAWKESYALYCEKITERYGEFSQ